MKKALKIIGIILVIAVVVIIAIFAIKSMNNPKSNFVEIGNAEALSGIIDNVYSSIEIELPNSLQTQVIDVADSDMISYVTGITDASQVEYVVASEPMMSSQAYSFVLVKVKDGVSADEVAKTMCDNIDQRKWICVTAEKVYTTSSGNVACLIMASEDVASPIYESFKQKAGVVGQEYQKTAEEPELPADMY